MTLSPDVLSQHLDSLTVLPALAVGIISRISFKCTLAPAAASLEPQAHTLTSVKAFYCEEWTSKSSWSYREIKILWLRIQLIWRSICLDAWRLVTHSLNCRNLARWLRPEVPELKRWKQGDQKFNVILSYIGSSRPACSTKTVQRKESGRSGETAWELGALADLSEDQGSIPSV